MRRPFPVLAPVVAACALALPLLGVAAPAANGADDSGPARPDDTAGTTFRAEPLPRAGDRKIDWTGWDDAKDWGRGSLGGVRVVGDRIVFDESARTRTYAGRRYEAARWTSPWTTPGFSFNRLIASWNATTPGDSWVEISVRGRGDSGRASSWDALGRWTSGDQHTKRRSVDGQSDDGASVNVDTWEAPGYTRYQLRIALLRRDGTAKTPSASLAGAVASRLPATAGPTSEPGPARGKVLPVPRYSQMVHRGHFPPWGGGGEAWCSPTSVSMVLGYYDALPRPKDYRYVPAGHVDPWVDHAARQTFDHAYDGTGNWPFNTAYAGEQAGSAFVTRLRSMRQAERFIADGIPLVISIAFGSGELSGAPISSSNGHLLVVVGFRDNGDVVVNDPAASSRDGVRRTYDRGQLERIWLEASGGTTYVVSDADHPLPRGRSNAW